MMLRWLTPLAPSLLHALRAVTERRAVSDPALVEVLSPFAETLRSRQLPTGCWLQAILQAARREVIDRRVAGCFTLADEAGGREGRGPGVDLFQQAADRLLQARPRWSGELTLRLTPLQQQWRARGPGLMRQLDRWMPPSGSSPGEVEAIGVIPVCGGAGEAYPPGHALWIEALLTDTDDRLPELARLAWLVTQLNLPADSFPADASGPSASMRQQAALLLTLALGQQLDWFVAAEPPLVLAWENWLRASSQQVQRWRSRLPDDWVARLLAQPGTEHLCRLSSRLVDSE